MTNETPQKAKLSGRYKAILGVSLAVNLLVVGMVAGAAFRFGGEGGPRDMRSAGLGAYGLPYMIALPPEARREIIREIKSERNGQKLDRSARRALYNDVLNALRAVPFDADSLATSVAQQADTTISVQQSAQSAWLVVVSQMSDAERQAYADEVENALKKRPRAKK
ncbi:periplasmic heavy metal sensor [Roseobacter sp.]|uniref:periplasmic heavy metal sensor n=1 Tax=Roseobacter sp. TaxID=1907202 RepID=UPI00385FE416